MDSGERLHGYERDPLLVRQMLSQLS